MRDIRPASQADLTNTKSRFVLGLFTSLYAEGVSEMSERLHRDRMNISRLGRNRSQIFTTRIDEIDRSGFGPRSCQRRPCIQTFHGTNETSQTPSGLTTSSSISAARRTALLTKIAIHETLAKIDPTFSPNNPERTRGNARVAMILIPAVAHRVRAKSSQMIRVIHFHGWILLNPKPIRSATLLTTERTLQVRH